jgi:hypothetical protein
MAANDFSPHYLVLVGGLMVVAVAYTCAALRNFSLEQRVRTRGVPVLAALVQAHRGLFSPGWSDLPIQVVFTFDRDVPDPEYFLRNLAAQVFALKNRTDVSKTEAVIAQAVTEELYQPGRRLPLPTEMTGGPVVYLGDVMIRRADLPERRLIGKLLMCKALPGRSGRLLLLPAPEVEASGAGRCEACGRAAPTRHVVFHRHIGAVVVFLHNHIKGNLCRPCIDHYFWNFTGATLGLGWWGFPSCFLTPVYLLLNVIRYARAGSPSSARTEREPGPSAE